VLGKVSPDLVDMPCHNVGGACGTGEKDAGINDKGEGIIELGIDISSWAGLLQ